MSEYLELELGVVTIQFRYLLSSYRYLEINIDKRFFKMEISITFIMPSQNVITDTLNLSFDSMK